MRRADYAKLPRPGVSFEPNQVKTAKRNIQACSPSEERVLYSVPWQGRVRRWGAFAARRGVLQEDVRVRPDVDALKKSRQRERR